MKISKLFKLATVALASGVMTRTSKYWDFIEMMEVCDEIATTFEQQVQAVAIVNIVFIYVYALGQLRNRLDSKKLELELADIPSNFQEMCLGFLTKQGILKTEGNPMLFWEWSDDELYRVVMPRRGFMMMEAVATGEILFMEDHGAE